MTIKDIKVGPIFSVFTEPRHLFMDKMLAEQSIMLVFLSSCAVHHVEGTKKKVLRANNAVIIHFCSIFKSHLEGSATLYRRMNPLKACLKVD